MQYLDVATVLRTAHSSSTSSQHGIPLAYIALCLWTEDRQTDEPYQRTVDPYVTWFIRPEAEGIICYQGHYHDQLGEALLDFNNRM